MAPFGLKLWENAFQTIPNISFFDVEKKIRAEKIFGVAHRFLDVFVKISRSYDEMDLIIDCSQKFALDTPFLRSVRPQKLEKTWKEEYEKIAKFERSFTPLGWLRLP